MIITQCGRENIPNNVITVTNDVINVKSNVFRKSRAAYNLSIWQLVNKKTQWHIWSYIFFNRTIHIIKYLHAENGNRTAWSNRCDHNCRNRLCPVIKGVCHHRVVCWLYGEQMASLWGEWWSWCGKGEPQTPYHPTPWRGMCVFLWPRQPARENKWFQVSVY